MPVLGCRELVLKASFSSPHPRICPRRPFVFSWWFTGGGACQEKRGGGRGRFRGGGESGKTGGDIFCMRFRTGCCSRA